MKPSLRVLALAAALAGCSSPTPATDTGSVPTDAASPVDASADVHVAAPCEGPPGLYVAGSCTELAPGVRPFTPHYLLWSDGAEKERFVHIPPGTTIDTSDPNAWIFPVGTTFWKTFSRDGLRIETRINTKVSDGTGASYWTLRTFAWSADQLSVAEVTDGVINALGTDHDIPAASLCVQCHTGAAHDVGLGFSAIQLNHVGSPLTLQDLETEGLLSANIPLADAVIPGDATTTAALGYLHANCGGCHGGPTPFPPGNPMRLWIDVGITDVTQTGPYLTAVGVASGWPGAPMRVTSGDPDTSAIVLRMQSRTPGMQMPPIATELVHPEGVAAVRAWISSLH